MKAHAPTTILCITANPRDHWQAFGPDRFVAEVQYMNAIVTGAQRPPLYRVVVQFKTDQHDRPDVLTAVH